MEFKDLIDDFNNFTKNQDLGESLNISKQTSSTDNRGGKIVKDVEKAAVSASKGLQNQDSGANNPDDSSMDSTDDNDANTPTDATGDTDQDQTTDNEPSAQ